MFLKTLSNSALRLSKMVESVGQKKLYFWRIQRRTIVSLSSFSSRRDMSLRIKVDPMVAIAIHGASPPERPSVHAFTCGGRINIDNVRSFSP